MLKNKKGFTLIELLIVIGIIAILAGIVLVAVNPAKQFGKANDSERKSEIAMILSSIYQFQTSPTARGALPQCTVDSVAQDIPLCGTEYAGALELGTAATSLDCSGELIPDYLREMPIDPDTNNYDATATGYWICRIVTGEVSNVYVIAENAEVYTSDGGCSTPGDAATDDAMCVTG